MSQATTLVLLPQTAHVLANGTYDVVGNKVAAASYYISCKSLQTVNINVSSLTGNIIIQASLSTEPSANMVSTDWFKVYEMEANTSISASTAARDSANASMSVNIDGNFVWMRALVEDFSTGVVNWVKLSY
jgi:hypothetical protein